MRTPPLRSLRRRLVLGSLLGVALAMLLAGVTVGHLYRIHTTDRFQSELDHHLDELNAMLVTGPDGAIRILQPLSDPLFKVADSGLYWQVEWNGGHILRSPSLGNRLLHAIPDGRWHEARLNQEAILQRSALTRDASGAAVVTTIASAQSLVEAQVAAFHTDLAVSVAIVAVLLILGAALVVRFGLAPLQLLGIEIGRLRNGEISRLPHVGPAEFTPIILRLNALLDGQAQLIARARSEAGNLAHELRTPLALIADEAEQLRLRGETQAGDFLLERCDAMKSQINRHLNRAAIAGMRGAGTLTLARPLVEQIVAAMRRLYAHRELRIIIDVPSTARLPIDDGDLAEVLSNLVDNACKWTRSTVAITVKEMGLEVRDDGPGIPPDQWSLALSIGGRLDPSTPGAGLGLAGVLDVLRSYDAALQLDRAVEGGLAATVSWSASAPH